MIEALLFWALAVYGASSLVWLTVAKLQERGTVYAGTAEVICIVRDADRFIEGVLRQRMLRTVFARRPRRITVIDTGSQDDTEKIVDRMSRLHAGLGYVRVSDDQQLAETLLDRCLSDDGPQVRCIYDLRTQAAGGVSYHGVVDPFDD